MSATRGKETGGATSECWVDLRITHPHTSSHDSKPLTGQQKHKGLWEGFHAKSSLALACFCLSGRWLRLWRNGVLSARDVLLAILHVANNGQRSPAPYNTNPMADQRTTGLMRAVWAVMDASGHIRMWHVGEGGLQGAHNKAARVPRRVTERDFEWWNIELSMPPAITSQSSTGSGTTSRRRPFLISF